MSTTYRTREDDVLDWVCWRHYGRQKGTVELVLDANPGLAAYGPRLPGNLVIEMPDLPTPDVTPVVKLWD